MQIVVPRTCDDSCTGLLKREACQVGTGPLLRAFVTLRRMANACGCFVLVRGCTVMQRPLPLIRCPRGLGTRCRSASQI
ncbi:hypothetical protein C1891_21330 [Pseudomonas sp. GW456-12-1-14-TSB6]|nr:hypothetical protein C1891_21330 [Pseudomonas sp. GW456-12-1-14-TSB6]